MDTTALLNYSFTDNIKDFFNLSNIDSQDIAQNLSLTHDIPVHDNLDNLPQNLSTMPQNLTNMSSNLGNGLNCVAQSHNINQSYLGLPQNITGIPENLSSHGSSYSHTLHGGGHDTLDQGFSRIPHMNVPLATNFTSFGTLPQTQLALPQTHHNNIMQNRMNAMPQNLSSTAQNIPHIPQNLTMSTNPLSLPIPLMSHNSAPQNLTSQSISTIPQNLSTLSSTNIHNVSSALSSKLGSHNQFNNFISQIPTIHDLSEPQNLSSSSNLDQITPTPMAEELLQPQNLSQNNLTQPENLTMPQNLSSSHNPDRRNQCINRSQDVPQNLSSGSIQLPQNLSYHPNQSDSSIVSLQNGRHFDFSSTKNVNQDLRNYVMSELPLSLSPPNLAHLQNMSNNNNNLSLHGDISNGSVAFNNSLSGNISNSANINKFCNPQNLSIPTKMSMHSIQDLSCHSKPPQKQENVPENLSLASCMDQQPQNLSLTLQPQNLSHNKSNTNYGNAPLGSSPFIIPQPQNLSQTQNWVKYA